MEFGKRRKEKSFAMELQYRLGLGYSSCLKKPEQCQRLNKCPTALKALRNVRLPINMGEVKLIRLTLYYIPGPLPKVHQVVFLCGIFWGDTLSVAKLNWKSRVCLYVYAWLILDGLVDYNLRHFLWNPLDTVQKSEWSVMYLRTRGYGNGLIMWASCLGALTHTHTQRTKMALT